MNTDLLWLLQQVPQFYNSTTSTCIKKKIRTFLKKKNMALCMSWRNGTFDLNKPFG